MSMWQQCGTVNNGGPEFFVATTFLSSLEAPDRVVALNQKWWQVVALTIARLHISNNAIST